MIRVVRVKKDEIIILNKVPRRFRKLYSYVAIDYNLQQLNFGKFIEMQTPFIKKVKVIMEDSKNRDIICWNDDKTMIQIRNEKIFQQKILSRHFRHSRISSFIRQLNLYGFKKIRTAQYRVFTHPLLQKGLGLQAILNKKKKTLKNGDQNDIDISLKVEMANSKLGSAKGLSLGEEIEKEYRTSQNLISKKENQKIEKIGVSTNNPLSPSQQPFSMMWIMPMQQPSYRMPFSMSIQGTYMNFNCNPYHNWC